jgi:hypothetical protein
MKQPATNRQNPKPQNEIYAQTTPYPKETLPTKNINNKQNNTSHPQ